MKLRCFRGLLATFLSDVSSDFHFVWAVGRILLRKWNEKFPLFFYFIFIVDNGAFSFFYSEAGLPSSGHHTGIKRLFERNFHYHPSVYFSHSLQSFVPTTHFFFIVCRHNFILGLTRAHCVWVVFYRTFFYSCPSTGTCWCHSARRVVHQSASSTLSPGWDMLIQPSIPSSIRSSI